jgi:outer membrane lipoprotein-sorting protein
MRLQAFSLVTVVFLSGSALAADPQEEGGAFSTAAELIQAMHSAYEGEWYEKLTITQKVEFYKDGEVEREEVWNEIIELPGKVRSNILPVEDGNAEVFLNGTYYWFRDGELEQQRNTEHVVLLLGFDVYLQDPDSTMAKLGRAEFDLEKMHVGERDGRPVYVVGAEAGDQESNQFWIDQERLVFVGQVTRSNAGNLIEVALSEFEPLEEGWIATRFQFKRNGDLVLDETYQEYHLLEEIDPAVFDVENFKTEF